MLKDYPKFVRGQIDEYFDTLPSTEKKIIKDYLEYRKARGLVSEEKVRDVRRYILHLRFIIDKNFKEIDLETLRSLLAIINSTKNLSEIVKNNLKIDLKNFLKFLFDDWSRRFKEFDDIKIHSNTRNERRINSSNILEKSDIEKLMKHENKMYWKAFLMTQYETAFRTKEVRLLKWNDIKFNVDGDISEINTYATKTKRSRTVFVKEATFYLKKLKEEQENEKIKSVYVFPMKKNVNHPINKTTVSMWMRELGDKALGKSIWNYLLRHSRATELYRLAKQGKISKDTAIEFMGHSEDMSNVYTHLDSKEIKEMLKNQVYKLEEIPEEKKHELEVRIDEQDKMMKEMRQSNEKLAKDNKKMNEQMKEMLALVDQMTKSVKKQK